nr:BatA and WFA domain-containing protein [Tissierella sp.]
MIFSSPLYLIFILGLVPLLLMYLLKKQHEDVTLSSNYLWNRMLKDIEANKPWQKLRNNLLMILQILVFSLLVLGLARPILSRGNISSDNLIIILDNSASMKSQDLAGKSRFDKAKSEIEDLIKNTKGETKISLVSMDTKPELWINNSSDKGLLKKTLDGIGVNDSSDKLGDTISMVKALVKEMASYDIILFTDKVVQTDMEHFQVNIINEKRPNLSVDNIAYSPGETGITALTTLTNHSDSQESFDLLIYGDEVILDVQEISLEAKESRDVYFENLSKALNILKVEIDLEDSLETDNTRYAVVNSEPIKKVLIVSEGGNIFLEKAIGVTENIEVFKFDEKPSNDLKGYDAYIFDGVLPDVLPKDGNIVMFNPNSNSLFKVSTPKQEGNISLIDDELFRYVSLDFYIEKTNTIEGAEWLRPILKLDEKTIIAKGVKDKQKMVVVGFDIRDTDLPLRMDFPIFMQNILDYTLNINTQEKVEVASGEAISINILPKSKEASIIDPTGKKQLLTSPVYSDTFTSGIYTIEQKTETETLKSYFVSNIDTSKESLDKAEAFEGQAVKEENTNKARVGKDIRNIILLFALALISFEWVVYNRGY